MNDEQDQPRRIVHRLLFSEESGKDAREYPTQRGILVGLKHLESQHRWAKENRHESEDYYPLPERVCVEEWVLTKSTEYTVEEFREAVQSAKKSTEARKIKAEIKALRARLAGLTGE